MLSSYMSTGTGTGTTSPVGPGVPIEKRRVKGCLKKKLAYFGLSAQKGEGGMVEITKKLLDQMGIQMLRMAPT